MKEADKMKKADVMKEVDEMKKADEMKEADKMKKTCCNQLRKTIHFQHVHANHWLHMSFIEFLHLFENKDNTVFK